VRVAFAALVCTSAIGCFVGDLLFFDSFGPLVVVPLSLISFAVVGALLVVRRPGRAIGWLFGAAGAAFGLVYLSGVYAYASVLPGASLPANVVRGLARSEARACSVRLGDVGDDPLP